MENNNNNNAEQEQWLPVPDEPYNKSFAISNFGRVKNINTDKIKSQMKNESTGYYSIRLDVGKKAKKITYQIHQLVAKLFIGECPDKFVVTHLDGNRTNNKAANLKYMSLTDAMARYNNKEKKSVSENKIETKKLDINKLLSDSKLQESKKDIADCNQQNTHINKKSDEKSDKKCEKKCDVELDKNLDEDNGETILSDNKIYSQINTMEHIKGYPQYLIDKKGNIYQITQIRIKKTLPNPTGYERITLSSHKKRKNLYVHRLVADAFIPNPKNLPYVNHKDANRKNNSVENLEWCSSQQNMLHDSKLRKTGKRLQAFTMDGKFVKEYESIKAAGRELKVDSTSITKAVSGANGRTTAGGYIWKYADANSDDEIDDDIEQSNSESNSENDSESETEQNKKIEVKPVKKIKSKSVSKKSETESESESESKSDSEDNSESDNNESDKPKISSKIIDKVKKTDRYRKKQNNN